MKSVGLLLTLLTVLLVSAPSAATAAKSCGTFRDPDGARIAVRIFKGTLSCTKAKSSLRDYALAIKADGCRSNACPKQFGIVNCSSATAGAFPRLYTCASQKTRYSAYSTAD